MSSILLRASKIDYLLMDPVPVKDSEQCHSDFKVSPRIFKQNVDDVSDFSSVINNHKDVECFEFHGMQQREIPVSSSTLNVSSCDQLHGSVNVFSSSNHTRDKITEAYNDITGIESLNSGGFAPNSRSSASVDISHTPLDVLQEHDFVKKQDYTSSLSPNHSCAFTDGKCLERSPESTKSNVIDEQNIEMNFKLPSETLQKDQSHLSMVSRVNDESCPFSEGEIPRDSISQEKLGSFQMSDEKDVIQSDIACKKQSSKVPRSVSPAQVHRCHLCGKHYRHIASLRNHMRKHASGALASKRHKCPYCVYSSQYNRNVLKHVEAVHQNPTALYQTNNPIPNNSNYIDRTVANNMNPVYWNSVHLNEHMYRAQDGNESLCNIANHCFYKQQTVRDNNDTSNMFQGVETSSLETYQKTPTANMIIDQAPNSVYYCNASSDEKPFKTAKCLATHLSDCRRGIRFKCPVKGCNFDNERQEHLKRHITQYHSERKNYLQELLTNVGEAQPSTAVPAFYASNNLRNQLTNPQHKRQMADVPFQNDAMISATQHTAHGYLPQNCPEPTRRIGMDVYSFPGSTTNQINDFAPRLQQSVNFDESFVNESSTDRCFIDKDTINQSRFQNDLIRPMTILRTGPNTNTMVPSSVSQLPTAYVPRSDIPDSFKRTGSPFCHVASCDKAINQSPDTRSADDSSKHIASSYSRIHAIDTRDSAVRSTVEQLLCAPDHSNQSLKQLFHKPSTGVLTVSDAFTSRGSPLEDFMIDIRRESNCTTRDNESTPTEFDSPNNLQDLNDNMSDIVHQKCVNSETDAFFSDLQEILARDMSSLDNSTPKTAEWLNGNPASVGLKEECLRSGELTTSKSPFAGYGTKPTCTASLLSGDSGVESWSSSSSCSAGPNGSSSVWGPPESMCNAKSSPSANTPQPSSVPSLGLQEPTRTHYESYSDGQISDEPLVGLNATPEIRVSQDSCRTPSKNYESILPKSIEDHQSSFVTNNVQHELMGDQSLLSPMISGSEQALRDIMNERNSNSTHCTDNGLPQTASLNLVFNSQTEVAYNPSRTASHPFSSVDATFQYGRGDSMDLADSKVQSNPMQMDASSVSQSVQYGRMQYQSHLNQHRSYLQQQHPPQHLHENGNPFVETPTVNFDVNGAGIVRHSQQNCTKSDCTVNEQQQQQCYHKSNPCPSFEQNSYRSANYARLMGPSTTPTTMQARPESPYILSNNVSGCPNPPQPSNVERRHGYLTCDINRVESDGSVFIPTSVEQTAEVEMKSAAHGVSFVSGKPNPYSYTDASGVARTDPVPNSNARYASYNPVAPYQSYPSAQQQQSHKPYYGGNGSVCDGPYDPVPTTNNLAYSVDQYSTLAPYSRQPNIPPCEAQLFMYHHQEYSKQQQQSQPVSNLAAMPSFSNYKISLTSTQSLDPNTTANYAHHTQRTPQHSIPRPPSTIPLQPQQNIQVRSRNPIQQQTPQHVASYSTIDRQALNRVSEIPNVTDLYPNTAGANFNPVWPAAADSCPVYPSDPAPQQNEPKNVGGPLGSLPTSVSRPTGSGTVCISSPYQIPQTGRPSVEPDCGWNPSISMANTDPSYGVRSSSINASPMLSGQPHHAMDRSGDNQAMDAFKGSLPTCPTMISR